jgi:hypothetical protein
MILTALALGIAIATVAAPALAEPGDGNKTDLGGIEKFLAASDRDTPQIDVGVVAGTDEEARPAWLEQRHENMTEDRGFASESDVDRPTGGDR